MILQLGRSRLILSFIVGVGLIAGYLGYSASDIIVPDQGLIESVDTLESFRDFTLDFSILDDERYKALEVFGENPVNIGITGEKKNPFDPI